MQPFNHEQDEELHLGDKVYAHSPLYTGEATIIHIDERTKLYGVQPPESYLIYWLPRSSFTPNTDDKTGTNVQNE